MAQPWKKDWWLLFKIQPQLLPSVAKAMTVALFSCSYSKLYVSLDNQLVEVLTKPSSLQSLEISCPSWGCFISTPYIDLFGPTSFLLIHLHQPILLHSQMAHCSRDPFTTLGIYCLIITINPKFFSFQTTNRRPQFPRFLVCVFQSTPLLFILQACKKSSHTSSFPLQPFHNYLIHIVILFT